jgi:general secretion pathway protein D
VRIRFLSCMAGCALVLGGGCSSVPVEQENQPQAGVQAPEAGSGEAQQVQSSPVTEHEPGSQYEKIPGSGVFIDKELAARKAEQASVDGTIVFNFEGEALQEVVKVILGDLLQENYVISPGVSGKVTFSTAKPIRMDQVMTVLEMLLSWNNASLVYFDDRYHVMKTGKAIPGQLAPVIGSAAAQKGYEVRVFPLEFIAPTEMEKLLQPYAINGAVISADNSRGLLVLGGTRKELENYQQTIGIFDVDWLKGMSVGIFPIQRVEADTVVSELEAVFGDSSGTPLAGMFRFMAIERLNAVLVITPQPRYLDKAAEWVERLDRGGSESGARLYVYAVKNVKADELASTLSEVFGNSVSVSRNTTRPGGDILGPGLQAGEITSINDRRRRVQEGQQQETVVRGQGVSRNADGSVSLAEGEDIRITAVEETTTLLIRATPQQYDSVLSAIKRLDIMAMQVLIEVKVLEVTLTDDLKYGVQWFFKNSLTDFNGFAEDATSGSGGTLSGVGGLTYAIRGGDTAAIINILEGITEVNAIASPSMMVLNNREANINVGTQIPVNSTVFNTGGSSNLGTNRVQFRDTGITMNVVPRVNPGGMVFMEVQQEVSLPIEGADAQGNVSINQRRISTEVAVQSGETVVLGGLMQATENIGKSGLPVLSSIPWVGGLFGSQSHSVTRTEMLVLITPTVISSIEDARDVSREYQQKMKAIDPFDLSQIRTRAGN